MLLLLKGFHCSSKGNISRESVVCCLSMTREVYNQQKRADKIFKAELFFLVMVQSNHIDLCWKRYQLILISILSNVLAEITAIFNIHGSLGALDM
jgi:hypothetical protein